MFIVNAILGICIMIENLSIGKRRMYIHTPGWHTFYFITFISVSVTWWRRWPSGGRWHSGRRCRRFWWRCAGSFVPPVCLWILCCAILAWKAAGRLIFINHCQISFYPSVDFVLARKLNSSLLLFTDFSARFLD